MAVQANNPTWPVAASATLVAYRCVTAAGAHAGVSTTDDIVGVAQEGGESGDDVTLRLRSAGTCKAMISEAVANNAVLYKAADGKLSVTSARSVAVARALEAGSGDGSIIEVQFY